MTERTQIYFLGDVLVAIESLDLEVPINAKRYGELYHGYRK